jgi:HK97 family phage prohead protease
VSSPLASVKAGTLKLSTARAGISYRMWPILEGVGAYAMRLVNRGDVTGSSAGFMVDREEWTVDDDDIPHRAIVSATLREVSLVPWPAYSDATAEPRESDLAKLGRRLTGNRTRLVRVGDRYHRLGQ